MPCIWCPAPGNMGTSINKIELFCLLSKGDNFTSGLYSEITYYHYYYYFYI